MTSVIILAAGFGTRMRSNTPKVLHKVCGKEMIYHVIDRAMELSSDINVVLFNQKDSIMKCIEQYYPPQSLQKIRFITQSHATLPGTGGALMQKDKSLINVKHEHVLILSGDAPLINSQELLGMLTFAREHKLDILLGGCRVSNPHGYGRIELDSQGNVSKVVEQKDASEEQLKNTFVNSGIYCCKKAALEELVPQLRSENAQREYYLTDIVEIGAHGMMVGTYELDPEHCVGVNSKLDLSMAETIMARHIKDEAMANGVIIHIPESVYIESGVSFKGESEIEPGVCIRGDSLIEDSLIKSNSIITDSIIKGSSIGPNAHIRPNCKIINSHIGNFVECKNANIDSAKAGHLSYLGDCDIGQGSNIGAGVICCNYDGRQKHKTKIGRNVFVGSDCQLIAPIQIEDEVIIAAGTTLTKDVQTGQMAISRKTQVNVKDGYQRFFGKTKR